MADNKVLNVTGLDFDKIKGNLVDFLKDQDQFKDYDFEGSALNVLLDVLAYNTHYQSYYLNMMANEMFLDSALLRSSVVSKAKHLNYLPRSTKAATAIIDLEVFPHDSPSSVVLNRNTRFISKIGDDTFTFVPAKAYTLAKQVISGKAIYRRKGIELKQGEPLTYKWKVNRQNPTQKFIIPNPLIDIETLVVKIQYNENSSYKEEFKLAKDTNRISGEDKVYYLQEVDEGKYEIFFGDGILGYQLDNNNIVHIDYLTTSGKSGNHASVFSPLSSIGGYSETKITTVMKSSGGAERESIESIKFHAPRTFEGQNRAVTARDYRTIVPQIYPNIQSLNVWGGEDNDPPFYGRAMIAIKPDDGFFLSDAVKNRIEQTLIKDWSVVSITPMIVDPDYIEIIVDTTAKFNEMVTVLTSEDIKKLIIDRIEKYNDETLSNFESYFRYSKFVAMIDGIESSITNNLTTIKMKKSVVPSLHSETYYELRFNNSIKPLSLKTSYFDVGNELIEGAIPNKRYFVDDGNGYINLNIVIGTVEQTYVSRIGTIDYDKGIIKINNLKVNWFDGDAIDFIVDPKQNDIVPLHNQILSLDMDNLTVNVIDDTDLG